MTVTFPEAVSSHGRKKVVILSSAPSDEAALTATEITAGVEATMYLLGSFAPAGTQNKGNSPKRVGERSQLQVLGNATYESPTLSYVHDPQGADADEANVVKAALPVGGEVWIAERAGLDVETAFATADQYRIHHLVLGEQWFAPSGDDEFAIEQVTQETGYLTPPVAGAVTV